MGTDVSCCDSDSIRKSLLLLHQGLSASLHEVELRIKVKRKISKISVSPYVLIRLKHNGIVESFLIYLTVSSFLLISNKLENSCWVKAETESSCGCICCSFKVVWDKQSHCCVLPSVDSLMSVVESPGLCVGTETGWLKLQTLMNCFLWYINSWLTAFKQKWTGYCVWHWFYWNARVAVKTD